MDPPLPPATNPIPSAVTHADSADSSPRSRTTETFDDRESLGGGSGGKLRFMCSFGGHIIPRPHDKSLSYVGGDTRMVVVDRKTGFGELKARLSKTLLHDRDFTFKYQLPNEDLDSLISVATDEDFENMIDEFDRICGAPKSNRMRVFLFLNKPESSGSSIESILDGSVKSEDWFYNALNGSGSSAKARGLGFADVNSVNSLLGLENDSNHLVSKNGGSVKLGISETAQKSCSTQDTSLNPDSLMFETSSSFGSASSSPSLANLPPIKVGLDGGGGSKVVQEPREGVWEEQFPQMSVSAGGKQDEGLSSIALPSASPPFPTTLVPANMVRGIQVNPGISSGGLPDQFVPEDQRSDLGGYGSRQPQIQLQTQSQQQPVLQQQKQSGIFDIASPDSVSSDGSILYQDPVPVAPITSGFSGITSGPVDSNISRVQVQQKLSEPGYILHSQTEQHYLNQQSQQQPQQFLHPGTQYIQHPQNAMPTPQYYHPYPPQHSHPLHGQQQYPVYFMPPTERQSQQAYSMPIQQGTYNELPKAITSSHTQNPLLPAMITNPTAYKNQRQNVAPGSAEVASNMYTSAIPTAQQMVKVAAPGQYQQQYIGYSQVQHPQQSMPPPQIPAAATIPNYAYDPTHAQMYYTQPVASAPTHPAQYQATISSSSTQISADNMKQQNITSQGK